METYKKIYLTLFLILFLISGTIYYFFGYIPSLTEELSGYDKCQTYNTYKILICANFDEFYEQEGRIEIIRINPLKRKIEARRKL